MFGKLFVYQRQIENFIFIRVMKKRYRYLLKCKRTNYTFEFSLCEKNKYPIIFEFRVCENAQNFHIHLSCILLYFRYIVAYWRNLAERDLTLCEKNPYQFSAEIEWTQQTSNVFDVTETRWKRNIFYEKYISHDALFMNSYAKSICKMIKTILF